MAGPMEAILPSPIGEVLIVLRIRNRVQGRRYQTGRMILQRLIRRCPLVCYTMIFLS